MLSTCNYAYNDRVENIEHSKIIDRLGGNVAVAAIFKISSQAISKWRRDGIPEARLMYLKVAHPDAFQVEPAVVDPHRQAA